MTSRDYADKVAVITGAANGLGRALAKELARRGSDVALMDSDFEGLARVGRELSDTGVRITEHCADVACEEAMQSAAAKVLVEHGGVDLLINNAGISISAPFEKIDTAAFERVIQVNFLGVVYGCRAFLPALRQRPRAQIMNVASSFAWHGYPGKTAYAASKGAVTAFTESLRLECAAVNLGVTLLYPGLVATGIVAKGTKEAAFLGARGSPPEAVARRAIGRWKSNPARIVIGFDYRVLDAIARISPALASRVAATAAARLGF